MQEDRTAQPEPEEHAPGILRRLWPALLGAAVLVPALLLLHRELRHYDLHVILSESRAIPGGRIAAALLLTAGSYLLLTFYDVLALRHAGHPLGYARTAAASFTSYVASHNIGLSGVGGTAVRYRLYTAFGLSAVEIAEVVAFCALTFWVGFLFVAGVTFTLAPIALPEDFHALVDTTRPLGALFLVLCAGFLAWSLGARRPLAWRSWSFSPPSGRMLLLSLIHI